MGKIADISKWQGNIDWGKAAAELDLVILRVQDGNYADPRYQEYAAACKRHGIPFGVYAFTRYTTIDRAKSEAALFLRRCEGTAPLFFVADVEVKTMDNMMRGTSAFIGALRDAGKKTGLYVSQALYPSVDVTQPGFIWIPRYGTNSGAVELAATPKYPCDLWQYTSNGKLAGVAGRVDLNVLTGRKPLSWFLGQPAPSKLYPSLYLFGDVDRSTLITGETRIDALMAQVRSLGTAAASKSSNYLVYVRNESEALALQSTARLAGLILASTPWVPIPAASVQARLIEMVGGINAPASSFDALVNELRGLRDRWL